MCGLGLGQVRTSVSVWVGAKDRVRTSIGARVMVNKFYGEGQCTVIVRDKITGSAARLIRVRVRADGAV